MKHSHNLLIASFLLMMLFSCQTKTTDNMKYKYETFENDPLNVKVYTLKNGLKIFMSVNKDEPRISTNIAVKAGSKNDPSDATGLAHYLEHMMFKGTSHIATSNWTEESKLLEQISALYEDHKATADTALKRDIYHKIDSLSNIAAQYAVPNEYDKMVSSIGASGTNAYTSVDQTVYVNDIPSNELEKWMIIESERFQELVLRLFHTELETVYEEFNRGQDNDGRKTYATLFSELFKKHPYSISTIGKGEHLKNPSMVKIHEYFNNYYVPNNMAIVLAGDFNPDEVVELVEKYFGNIAPKDVPKFTYEPEDNITAPIIRDVYGSDAESVTIGFRGDGANTNAPLYMKLVDGILNNGKAGLIDLNLQQKQKVLSARTGNNFMKDYTVSILSASPREGQSLEEAKDLLLEQVELLKKGEFEDWLVEAVINDLRLWNIKSWEDNKGRVGALTDAYIKEQQWNKVIDELERMKKITKQEILQFANAHFKDNYVIIYKHTGKDTSVANVQKPKITAIKIERNEHSDFYSAFDTITSERIAPVFIDYEKAIEKHTLNNDIPFSYIKNTTNELFSLVYILDMGTDNDKKFALASQYLPYLGTSTYSAEDLQKEFFKLGLEFNVNTSKDRINISLSGLEDNIEQGIKLFEHILSDVQGDETVLKNLIDGILKKRADAKLNKSTILNNAMVEYGLYGENAPIKNILSEKELMSITPDELVNIIKSISTYKHRIFYYGQKEASQIVEILNQNHKTAEQLLDYPPAIKYTQLDMDKNKVYFVDYNMVQNEMVMASKFEIFNKDYLPYAYLYNDYFGSGLSSIIFQELREAKALAYSTYSTFTIPDKKEKAHYIFSYIGTQSDKLQEATAAMKQLMDNMPEAEKQFEEAKTAALKRIETNRITKSSIFWDFEKVKELGFDYDIRKDNYEAMKNINIKDLKSFFDKNIKGRNYTYLVIGNKQNTNMKVLNTLGEVKELSLETIFGY